MNQKRTQARRRRRHCRHARPHRLREPVPTAPSAPDGLVPRPRRSTTLVAVIDRRSWGSESRNRGDVVAEVVLRVATSPVRERMRMCVSTVCSRWRGAPDGPRSDTARPGAVAIRGDVNARRIWYDHPATYGAEIARKSDDSSRGRERIRKNVQIGFLPAISSSRRPHCVAVGPHQILPSAVAPRSSAAPRMRLGRSPDQRGSARQVLEWSRSAPTERPPSAGWLRRAAADPAQVGLHRGKVARPVGHGAVGDLQQHKPPGIASRLETEACEAVHHLHGAFQAAADIEKAPAVAPRHALHHQAAEGRKRDDGVVEQVLRRR